MNKTLIALATATLAVLATPATAATGSLPTAGHGITTSIAVQAPAQASVESAELRGKRRGTFRSSRHRSFKHRRHFRGSRFRHHDRRFKAKHFHHRHHDRFVHDRHFNHRNLKAKRIKSKKLKRFKH